MSPRKQKKINQRVRKRVRTTVYIVAAFAVFALVGTMVGAILSIPDWSPEALQGEGATTLYDRNMETFRTLHAEENRIQVPLSQVPSDLINAFIATEDRTFYTNIGINPLRIGKALIVDILTGSKAQGASTITQQLAKNAFLTPEKTYTRKIKEIVLALELERRYSKDEILQFYLNKINFGSGAWGVQTAAQLYFGKNVQDLNLAECALLAGLVQSPNGYSPYNHLDRAKKRQREVLNNMVECGYITQKQADKAYEEPLNFKEPSNLISQYGFFTDYVVEEADRILGELGLYDDPQNAIYRGGLKIYTTLDPKIQAHAEEVYSNPASFPAGQKNKLVQSGMVLLDHHTGEILALMGGREYKQQRGFNRATSALRQPGSAFKPLVVYGPALELGIGPDYIIDDSPVTYNFGGKTWTPENYDGKYRGPIDMWTAVKYSVNVYAVKLADEIGIRNGIKFAEKCGIDTLQKTGTSNDYNLSTALGGITRGVSVLDMASGYGCFANEGIRAEPYVITRIVDDMGNTIYQHKPYYERVMKKSTASQMNSLLMEVVRGGTGTNAQIAGVDCAGKTGTTQNDKDAWYIGYTPYYTCAVWMGYDSGNDRIGTYGGTYPARIWKSIMSKAIAGKSGKGLDVASGLTQVTICTRSNKLATSACPLEDTMQVSRSQDQVPDEPCDVHVLLKVCVESGQLATEYCPHTEMKGFLKDASPGDLLAAPTEYCSIHGSTQSKVKVLMCTDPRHNGQPYRARIPGINQVGGCPSDYIQEMEVDDPGSIPYCSLSDHQILP